MSDLVRIAKYHNKYVIGYSSGKRHTSNLLKKCCDEFIICRKPIKNSGNVLSNASSSLENTEILVVKKLNDKYEKILDDSDEKLDVVN